MATPMTPDQMLKTLQDEGLTVVEVPGWRERCRCCPDTVAHRPAGPFVRGWGDINGQLAHITAGGLGSRTVLQYIRDIINGDPGVPVKSHTVIPDEKRTVYLNSAGRCNHAGKVGGSVRSHMIAADFSTTDDFDNRFTGGTADGNAFTYGDECIAAKSMSADQYDTLVRVHAARARFHGWTGQESVGHGEVSNQRGKGDPNRHMGQFRRDVMARVKAGPLGGDVDPDPVEPDPDPVVTDPPDIVIPDDASQSWLGRLLAAVLAALGKTPAPVEPTEPAEPDPTPTTPPSDTAVWGVPSSWSIGATGPDVTRLGQRLVLWAAYYGLTAPYKVGPGPEFTETDRQAVAAFQRAQGWSGADADGYPGPETFARLAAGPTAVRSPNTSAPTALPSSMVKMYHVPDGGWYAIENSVLGLKTALALGYRWIDMDCHVTSDGVFVFGHNAEMAKDHFTLPAAFVAKYGADATIEQVTWADLKTLRTPVTTWRGEKLALQYVDAQTVLSWLALNPRMSVALELKAGAAFDDPDTFRRLRDLAFAERVNPDRLLVMSQPPWPNLLGRFKAAHPYFTTAVQRLSWKKPADWAQIAPHVDYYRSGNWGTKTR
jgi:hypothetical protein